MLYRLAADAVLVAHLGFIVFVLFGAVLALRWRWLPLLHLPAAGWGVFVEVSGRLCPLTHCAARPARQATRGASSSITCCR
jgi:hypothetical protein